MSTETELLLRKTEELSKLVSAMKILSHEREEELRQIKEKLADLSIAVKKDKCLKAGGKFEWVDSVLVKVNIAFAPFKNSPAPPRDTCGHDFRFARGRHD